MYFFRSHFLQFSLLMLLFFSYFVISHWKIVLFSQIQHSKKDRVLIELCLTLDPCVLVCVPAQACACVLFSTNCFLCSGVNFNLLWQKVLMMQLSGNVTDKLQRRRNESEHRKEEDVSCGAAAVAGEAAVMMMMMVLRLETARTQCSEEPQCFHSFKQLTSLILCELRPHGWGCAEFNGRN